MFGFDGLGRGEALAIAAAEDVHGDRQLVAAQLGLVGHLVGIDVDQLDHPVGVGAAGRGDQVGNGLAGDVHRRGQHVGV